MARYTKAQKKRLLKDIQSKASKCFISSPKPVISMKDYETIVKIVERGMNRLK